MVRYSDFKHHSRRRFDRFLEAMREERGVAAIHDAVIVGESRIHHWTDDDLAFHSDRTLLDSG